MRKGIAEACKTGWIYILDRTNGKPLIGIDENPVEREPRNATAATQPFPKGDAVMPQCPQPLEGWVLKCIFGAPWDTPTLMSRPRAATAASTGRQWPTAHVQTTST
jgi:hypothetical protein